MTKDINIDEIQLKIYEKLKESGWGDKLKTFILSNDFDSILNSLLLEVQQDKRFTPTLKQVFRAFECCNLKDLKVLILGQDPYPQPYVADGISFSCSNTNKAEASLRYMFRGIQKTFSLEDYNNDPDLSRWSKQGVLLLNSALTTTISKTGTHYELWKPFLSFLFDYLSINNPNITYVFLGKKAQEWINHIPEDSDIVIASHPASAAYKNALDWDGANIFKDINVLTKSKFNTEIIW